MPKKIRNELIFYYMCMFLFVICAVYSLIIHRTFDDQSLMIPLIALPFVILATYYRYYTSENEPGYHLPKYQFPYAVRRRWSYIHFISGIAYGLIIIVITFTMKDVLDSILLFYVFLMPGFLILGYGIKGLYHLSRQTEVTE